MPSGKNKKQTDLTTVFTSTKGNDAPVSLSREQKIENLLKKLKGELENVDDKWLTKDEKLLLRQLRADNFLDNQGVAIGDTYTKYRIQLNFGYISRYKGKEMDQYHEVQPDMSMSVSHLIQNHTRESLAKQNVSDPIYFNTQIPVFKDLTDVATYKQGLIDELEKTNQWIDQDIKRQKAEKEAKAKQEAEAKQEAKAKQEAEPKTPAAKDGAAGTP